MAKITYTNKTDKVAVTDPERQISAADMNEIKAVIATNFDEFSVGKNKPFFNPSCYDHSYIQEMDGLIISLVPLVNISKYGNLYLKIYANVLNDVLFGLCDETETTIIGYQQQVGKLEGYQALTLLDLDTQEPIFEAIVDSSKMDDSVLNHGKLLPLFLPNVKLKSNQDYFLGKSLNYGKIANLNIPVTVRGIKLNGLTVKIANLIRIIPH